MRSIRIPRLTITLLAGVALCLCLASAALALQPMATPQGIPYLSGGIGSDERAQMDAMAGQYNLKMEFARSDRAFLADVRVAFRGPVSGEVLSQGPILLIRLPAGSYAITATTNGVARTQNVSVGAGGLRTVAFLW